MKWYSRLYTHFAFLDCLPKSHSCSLLVSGQLYSREITRYTSFDEQLERRKIKHDFPAIVNLAVRLLTSDFQVWLD